jgi:hypothetical protein
MRVKNKFTPSTPLLTVLASVSADSGPLKTRGQTHFEDHIIGFVALPQPVEWRTDNLGFFLQMSVKAGPYAAIDVH